MVQGAFFQAFFNAPNPLLGIGGYDHLAVIRNVIDAVDIIVEPIFPLVDVVVVLVESQVQLSVGVQGHHGPLGGLCHQIIKIDGIKNNLVQGHKFGPG